MIILIFVFIFAISGIVAAIWATRQNVLQQRALKRLMKSLEEQAKRDK
jgi:hypothetical protein